MYKLLQFRLQGFVHFKRFRRLCVAAKYREDAAMFNPRLPCSAAERIFNHQSADMAQTTFRFYSTRGVRSLESERGIMKPSNTSTVDPEKEEEFVFLDSFDPEPDEEEEEVHIMRLQKDFQMNLSSTVPKTEEKDKSVVKQLRALELQLKSLEGKGQEVSMGSLIEFRDINFPLDENIIKTTKKKKNMGQVKIFGTPDVDEPIGNTCCSGCGAVLHCTALNTPGYLPSEKYKALLAEEQLSKAICQRCYLLIHHQKALDITMSKEEYRKVVHGIKSQKALVLLIVDLLDIPDSIVPDLLDLVGEKKDIVVLGNKVDLIPGDSDNYLQRIRRRLSQYCTDAGLGDNVKDIHLISGKTGYGVEKLISSLQRSWKYKGDVYLVGAANVGKSTLFNTLLDSDYCKSRAVDFISKATISPWPGTTLNLLKFPIINPTPYRLFRRHERLQKTSEQTEDDLPAAEQKRLQLFRKQGYLVGHIGRTFRTQAGSKSGLIEFDPDSLAYGDYGEEVKASPVPSKEEEVGLSHNEVKDAHWLYDTPGILKENDVLSVLVEKEVKFVVPTQAIVPRTFVLKPGMVLFLGALGRIDLLQAEKSCWFSVIASNRMPVHITTLEKADSIYQKHAGHTLLGVPMGGEERMKTFPPLVSQDFQLVGQGYNQAIADIKFSTAGWVAVTGVEGNQVVLRVHAPEATGVSLRSPPLLPHIVNLKGERIKKSKAYKPVKPRPLQGDNPLSLSTAQGAKAKKKKKTSSSLKKS
ncbi:nitric oxide-associated protein 1-like [Lampris incognitus]|uniref:nitric oxide-associated protein 1-like n=1 Tax=Lampris incognitus TaxID=2546036 RepID=UPI0024B6167B|nr:nitric oxide-associated protein 1-like [Lampris incognitus]